MDNLTHSLFGAVLGQTGLKRKTGLGMPALIIGANLPDVDATCVTLGTVSLAMRRGITHGPIAWVLLPLVLAALLYGYDRWQQKRGKRPADRLPVHFTWLYALAFIGCLSHPFLDWLNSYGIRFLEPFSSRWFYGDILFIIDIWLWLGLGFALWFSRRREKTGGHWQRPAQVALVATFLYIGINAAISHLQVAAARQNVAGANVVIPNLLPVTSWQRVMITGAGDGLWVVDGKSYGDVPLSQCDLDAARAADPEVEAFLFWSRAPYVWRQGENWILGDARFVDGRAGFMLPLPPGVCGP